MAEVFLSYAREDRARAEQVAQGLAAAGVEIFWDNEIPPGQTWADYIESKLTQCKALIVLWSENSTKSQWVREEARLGRDKGVLIPAMIDASQAPFGFGEVQAANLAGWNGEADHPNWRRFVDAVRAAQSREAPPRMQTAMSAPPRATAPAPQPTNTPAPETKKGGVPVWVWVVGAVVGTIAVLAVIGSMMPTPEVQQAQTQTAMNPTPAQPSVQPQTTDGSPQAIILAQLNQAQAALAQEGFQMIGQPATGGLNQAQTWNVPAELHLGVEYRILGVCDRDCTDLDLVLYDNNGAPILQDTAVSSQPVIGILPQYTGPYTVQVQMYQCSIEPCYWAVALYGRAAQ
jgi:hypothetical protein